MNCPVCGATNPDGYQFCHSCGKPNPNVQQQSPDVNRNANKGNDDVFVDSSEHLVASLSNGFYSNLSSGEGFMREDAYVTDKRVYYNCRHGILNITKIRDVIDLTEISCTKFVDVKHWGFLILGILLGIAGIVCGVLDGSDSGYAMIGAGILAALIFILIFVGTNKKHLRIEYAGGFIHFSIRQYKMQNVTAFQKAIYSGKDNIRKQANAK